MKTKQLKESFRNGIIYFDELNPLQLGYLHTINLEEEKYLICADCKRELNRKLKKGLISISDIQKVKNAMAELKEKLNINLNINNFFSEIFLIYYN